MIRALYTNKLKIEEQKFENRSLKKLTNILPYQTNLERMFSTFRYTKIKQLSKGSFGVIYRFKDEKRKDVAVKVLLGDDEENLKQFIKQMQLDKEYSQPGIIKCLNSKNLKSKVSKCFFDLELAKFDLKRRYEKQYIFD